MASEEMIFKIISVEGERIYTNVIRDVGLSCRFSDLR